MFKDRLNDLLEALQASATDIAAAAGFDRTNISRLKSGARTVSLGSSTAEKLINGILSYSANCGKTEIVRSVTNAGSISDKELKGPLTAWLFDGCPEKKGSHRIDRKKISDSYLHSFGKRLDAAMLLADISNARLSQMIHIDASLISRYRNGIRAPGANPDIQKLIADVLWDRINKASKTTELSMIMGLDAAEIDEDMFYLWLYRLDDLRDEGIRTAKDLISAIDAFSLNETPPIPEIDRQSALDYLSDNRSEYYGIKGFQEAVLRFLACAALEGDQELFLYSDQGIDWMTEPSFRSRWISLMAACLKNKVRIKIIHNIDRDLNEMLSAIKSWLPLYMSGMIDAFYCRNQKDPRFYHTIFFCKGKACIYASHVAGTENSGIYHYTENTRTLDFFDKQFRQLLQFTRHLFEIDPLPEGEKDPEITIVQNTLSIATMPEKLARSFNSAALYNKWKTDHSELLKRLEKQIVCECIPAEEQKDFIKDNFFTEKIRGEAVLQYTKEQYAAHIEAIRKLSDNCPNYRFVPVSEPPFNNVKLLITSEKSIIIHTSEPFTAFGVTHPLMCRAFVSYAMELKRSSQ